jgi:heme-degrading monooxygenase HmoA
MRVTRNVEFEIKPGKASEFKTKFDNDVVPMLKKQDGFRGELSLVNPQNRAIGISVWDSEKSAEQYRTDTYPKVLKTLESLIQGTPRVEMFEVATSTIG